MSRRRDADSAPLHARILWAVCALLVAISVPGMGSEEARAQVIYVYELGCVDCARVAAVLEGLAVQHPDLRIERLDIHTPMGRRVAHRLRDVYGAEPGPVPMVFAGDVAMVGATFYGLGAEPVRLTGLAMDLALEDAVLRARLDPDFSPLDRLPASATDLVVFVDPTHPAAGSYERLIDGILGQYPELGLVRLDPDDEDDRRTFGRLQRMFEAPGDPPALFVGYLAVVGDRVYLRREAPRPFAFGEDELRLVDSHAAWAVEEQVASPLERLRLREQLTLWVVIGAALLDSLNPCDFALMLLLMGTLILLGKRMKVLWAGLAFIAGTYVTYFTMGFLVYTLLGMTVGARGFRVPFLYAVSSLAILIGLWQMKDLLWYGRWFSIEIPERWKPHAKRLAESVASIPGAFVIGSLESLFLAPCTSGPYLAILTLLSQTTERLEGALLLLLYNFVFVIPLIVLAFLVHFGFTTTARLERWRKARAGKFHFITGLVMFVLGAGMIVAVRLGLL